jgi:hypothetical protein
MTDNKSKWDKLDTLAMLVVRMSDHGLPVTHRHYSSVNLHSSIAELFGMAKLGVLDIDYNRRILDLAVERQCTTFKWADKVRACKLLNDAWDDVRAAQEPRMFLRQYQDGLEPKRLIDEFVAKEWK